MSSGGYFTFGSIKNGKCFRKLFAHLVGKENVAPSVLYVVTNSPENNHLYRASFESGVLKTFPQARISPLELSPETARDDKTLRKHFEAANIVYFDGGNCITIKRVFDRFNLPEHCRRAVSNGAYVGGACAGGSIFAEYLAHLPAFSVEGMKGVSILSKTGISMPYDPNYDEQRIECLKQAIEDGLIERGIMIPANQGVLFDVDGANPHAVVTNRSAVPFFVDDQKGNALLCHSDL